MSDNKKSCAILDAARRGGASVCGIGISNMPLVKFLLGRGISVTARDKKEREQIGEEIVNDLEKMGVRTVFGAGYLDDINEAVIFRTPGLRPDNQGITAALDRGALLTSEMELFFELTPATVVAITGSDGKTTSTTLTHLLLSEHLKGSGNRAFLGGNIGEPLLPYVDEMKDGDFAVVELSSFQLMTMKKGPHRAAITNIAPNHLDWHTGMDEYIEAKKNIYSHRPTDWLVTNAENGVTAGLAGEYTEKGALFSSKRTGWKEITGGNKNLIAICLKDGKIVTEGADGEVKDILDISEIRVPGIHNVENFMTAIGNTYGIVTCEDCLAVARSFTGVEHRLELVRELDGVRYYNSSIDSSPTRTAAALSALTVKPIIICGGYDKKIPFAPLAEALCRRAAGVVLTGYTAEKIRAALDACPEFNPAALPVVMKPDFDEAVAAARSMARPGGVVLLSPACASFDHFRNFMERGNYFKKIVNDMK